MPDKYIFFFELCKQCIMYLTVFFFNLLTVGTSANGWTVFFFSSLIRRFCTAEFCDFPSEDFSFLSYLYIANYH